MDLSSTVVLEIGGMAARLSTKPDASFFRKIVVGAIGARAVIADLSQYGHDFIELERGSTDTKLWKDVKRKRVRIPDLVCTKCGQRIECRAKTKNDLAMSHSPNAEERSWNFGMVGTDWIAFPVCIAAEEVDSTLGRLRDSSSFWNEINRIKWRTQAYINYFSVAEFESHQHNQSRLKSGTEGAETFIQWKATFCTKEAGTVTRASNDEGKVTVRPTAGRSHTWTVKAPMKIVVHENETVEFGQVLAAAPSPIPRRDLQCNGQFTVEQIAGFLKSPQRTKRFTGVKLARFRQETKLESEIVSLVHDTDEDVYIRLEGISYLVGVCGCSAIELFGEYLNGRDEQNQLEAVIAMGETATEDVVNILASIVHDPKCQYFLRSAAAWSLGQTQLESANKHLVAAFADVNDDLRRDSLEALVGLGGKAVRELLDGLHGSSSDEVAGCAEALRQLELLPNDAIEFLIAAIQDNHPNNWIVWLMGQLDDQRLKPEVEKLRDKSPEIHYAINLMWSFTESWISQQWILRPNPRASDHVSAKTEA